MCSVLSKHLCKLILITLCSKPHYFLFLPIETACLGELNDLFKVAGRKEGGQIQARALQLLSACTSSVTAEAPI